MRKIISGKAYNTRAAKLLGNWDNGHSVSETLYFTKTGNYFIYSFGRNMSEYNIASSRHTIVPISYDKAEEWAKEKLNSEDYEKIFNPKVILQIEISTKAKQKLDNLHSETNQTLSAIIENLINSL